jgi:hypothetical protein
MLASKRIRILVPLLIAALALCGGCTGSGGGGGVTRELCLELVGASMSAPGEVVMQEGAGSTCGAFQVELMVTDVTDVFSVVATVEYDPRFAAFFAMTTDGSVLSQDGTQLTPLVQESTLGTITLGVARNAATGIDVNGTGKLLTLFFAPFDEGTGDITITTPCLTGSQQPPVPKAGVGCSGAMLVTTLQ